MNERASNVMLINATHPDETRIAVLENQKLVQLDVETPYQTRLKGNIYNATITSIEPSLNAAFVDYGDGSRHGFLPFKEINPTYLKPSKSPTENPNYQESLQVGQKLLIQVEKSERINKGAALTTFISLAGTYLVIRPNNPKSQGISKQAEGAERDKIKHVMSQLVIPNDIGVIVRTAGIYQDTNELQWDLDTLLAYWKSIQTASETHASPCLIHQESSALIRAIRDNLKPNIDQIIIDDETTFNMVREYVQLSKPAFVEKLSQHSHNVPLFTHYQAEQQIEQIHQREVSLPSGGSIVIDVAEAMTAIDVNSGKATSGSDIEATALQTNLEAAQESCRQIKLRDLGGIIMIDFIDMTSKKHRKDVEQALAQGLLKDKAKTRFEPIMELTGVLPLSRQRVRNTVEQDSHTTCHACNGTGSIRSIESFCSSILRLIEDNVTHEQAHILLVQLAVDCATYLLNEKRSTLNAIEARYNVKIFVLPNPNLSARKHVFKRIKHPHGKTQHDASYTYTEHAQQDSDVPSWTHKKAPKKRTAVLTQNLEQHYLSRPRSHPGLIKTIWEKMFVQTTEARAPRKTRNTSPPSSQQRSTRQRSPRNRSRHPRSRHSGHKSSPNGRSE